MIVDRIIKRIDSNDRKKIAERTKKYQLPDYDYRIELNDDKDNSNFSFFALGDTGFRGKKKRAKYDVADAMNSLDSEEIKFILHLGDLVYESGSREGYEQRFIKVYKHWIKHNPAQDYDNMVFTKPFLPVYGNHDYYDMYKGIPLLGRLIGEVTKEIGSGSDNGQVFEEAFIINRPDSGKIVDNKFQYKPGSFTRLPNRYYWYTYGNCAFFALDSNTLDIVAPPDEAQIQELKEQLNQVSRLVELKSRQYIQINNQIKKGRIPNDYNGKPIRNMKQLQRLVLMELAEAKKQEVMLVKQLEASWEDHDIAQLTWLKQVLQHPDVQDKWKIVIMHHPMYSGDGNHTDDPESIGIKKNLREILIENNVNLVLNGHAHCFEWLGPSKESEFYEQEKNICYITSGGGGRNLRKSILEESSNQQNLEQQIQFLRIAESKAYTALDGLNDKEKIHHFLKIDVAPDHLKLIPVGVVRSLNKVEIETPVRTKIFTKSHEGVTTDRSKLSHINIYKDRAPEGVFINYNLKREPGNKS